MVLQEQVERSVMRPLTASVSVEAVEKLRQLAARHERSVSAEVRLAVRTHLEREARRDGQ